MEERGLAEVGLRDLLETARSVRKDAHVEGRFLIVAEHAGRSWVVIVEPDEQDRVLVAITVFPLE